MILVISTFSSALVAADDRPPPEATEQWSPVPPVVTTRPDVPPSDAIGLFTGKSLDAWTKSTTQTGPNPPSSRPWKVIDNAMVIEPGAGDIQTKAAFGDVQLHLEFRTPIVVSSEGQDRANSGIFFMGRYELQILDSYRNATYVNGQAASVYKQFAPLVNASRPPGEWQTLDVVFCTPRFKSAVVPAHMTVFHNGVLVQNDVTLLGPTTYRGKPVYEPHDAKLPLALQDHGSPVAFRNIWVREIACPTISSPP
jgi:hypothetical protein